MIEETNEPAIGRRGFIQAFAAAAAGGSALASQGARAADAPDDGLDHRNERPDRMRYRKLGKTNFNCSALVFGCGAALRGGAAIRLLEQAYRQGLNHYDVGRGYTGSEAALASFIRKYQGDVWVTSKAPARAAAELGASEDLTAAYAKQAAEYWLKQMDDSLAALKADYVDAYYVQGVANPQLLKSEEIYNAFLSAKKAGKVGHFGFSSHMNAKRCLEAAIETGWYALAMIAVTPGGWYDYGARKLFEGQGTLKDAGPLLTRAREAGIGLVGMKAARHIALDPYGGRYGDKDRQNAGVTSVFDEHYDEKLMNAPFSPFQRSYAFCLENGLDVVNADMQNFKHFEENLIAARTSHLYFA